MCNILIKYERFNILGRVQPRLPREPRAHTLHPGPLVVDMPERMGVCGEEFVKFTEAHPEIKEMHFYTEPTEWEEDENEEN